MLKSPLSFNRSFGFQWILAQKYIYFFNPLRPWWRFVGGCIIASSTPCQPSTSVTITTLCFSAKSSTVHKPVQSFSSCLLGSTLPLFRLNKVSSNRIVLWSSLPYFRGAVRFKPGLSRRLHPESIDIKAISVAGRLTS